MSDLEYLLARERARVRAAAVRPQAQRFAEMNIDALARRDPAIVKQAMSVAFPGEPQVPFNQDVADKKAVFAQAYREFRGQTSGDVSAETVDGRQHGNRQFPVRRGRSDMDRVAQRANVIYAARRVGVPDPGLEPPLNPNSPDATARRNRFFARNMQAQAPKAPYGTTPPRSR